MNCKLIEKMFDQYMNGELDPETETEMERHISGCPDCAAKYADFMKMKESLFSVEDEPLPVGFHTAWTAKVKDYSQPRTARHGKLYKYMPALTAGIAAVAIVSVAFLSGVLNPAPNTMSLTQQEASVAQDSSAAGGAAPQPEAAQNENAAPAEEGSLFMTQLAPDEEAAQAPEADAARKEAADTVATEPLQIFVSQETFNSMIVSLDEKQIAYTLDGENIIVSVDEANQEAMASVFKENELELCAVAGGIFKFSISE